VAGISSISQGIGVPLQAVASANDKKPENLLENDDFLAQFGYVGGDVKNFWQSMIQRVQANSEGLSQEARDQQIAKQNAVPVHSVFRANGKIVAFIGKSGGITSTGGLGHVSTAGSLDEVAQNVKERLTQLYGNIQMETYPAGSGANVGMAGDEMFGRGPQMPSPEAAFKNDTKTGYMNTRLTFSAESLALFQDARKSFGL